MREGYLDGFAIFNITWKTGTNSTRELKDAKLGGTRLAKSAIARSPHTPNHLNKENSGGAISTVQARDQSLSPRGVLIK